MLLKAIILLAATVASVSAVSNATTSKRNGKVFSLFSIVQFPNDVCTTTSSTFTKGTCLAASECSSKSGSALGNCAAGFGVCCAFSTSTCSSTLSQNVSYITNPGFPSVYSTTGTCSITVNKCSADVCQLRLDFETMVMSVSTSVFGCCGDCTVDADSFTATGKTSSNPPVICGINTGQHMYLELGTTSSDTATLAFFTASTTTISNRKWKVKVTQISCKSKQRVPQGCVQYHTGTTGNVQTYGFASSQLLGSQVYTNCLRQEEGYCSVTWRQSTKTSPDAFDLDNAAITLAAQNPINALITAGAGNGCSTAPASYIIVKGGSFGSALSTGNVFCGENLSADTVTETVAPGGIALTSKSFELGVFSDAATHVTTASATTGLTGINLDYQMNLCT